MLSKHNVQSNDLIVDKTFHSKLQMPNLRLPQKKKTKEDGSQNGNQQFQSLFSVDQSYSLTS